VLSGEDDEPHGCGDWDMDGTDEAGPRVDQCRLKSLSNCTNEGM